MSPGPEGKPIVGAGRAKRGTPTLPNVRYRTDSFGKDPITSGSINYFGLSSETPNTLFVAVKTLLTHPIQYTPVNNIKVRVKIHTNEEKLDTAKSYKVKSMNRRNWTLVVEVATWSLILVYNREKTFFFS